MSFEALRLFNYDLPIAVVFEFFFNYISKTDSFQTKIQLVNPDYPICFNRIKMPGYCNNWKLNVLLSVIFRY